MAAPLLKNIIGRAVVGPDAYVWALQSAYQSGIRLYEPSFAIDQDAAFDEICRRDPVVLQAMNDRLASAAGNEWTINPASEDEDDKDLAAIVESLFRRIVNFEEGRRNLAQSIFNGRAYAEVCGERKEIKLPARSRKEEARTAMMWVPRRLKDVDSRRVRWGLVPTRGMPIGETQLQYWSLDALDWLPVDPAVPIVSVTYDNREGTLGYGRGLRDAIFHYCWAKTQVLREGLQGIERWAQGMVVAKVDSMAPGSPDQTAEQVKAAFLETLKAHRARFGAIVMDKRDEVDVIFPSGTGGAEVRGFVEMLDNAITRLISGALLPSGGGSTTGSLARAEEEGSTIERVTRLDRALIDGAFTHDLIRRLVKVNRPELYELGLGDAEAPRFQTLQKKTEDPTANVGVISGALSAGIKLRADEVYRKLGFTQPTADDEVLEGMPPSPDAMLGSIDSGEDRKAASVAAKEKASAAKKNGDRK